MANKRKQYSQNASARRAEQRIAESKERFDRQQKVAEAALKVAVPACVGLLNKALDNSREIQMRLIELEDTLMTNTESQEGYLKLSFRRLEFMEKQYDRLWSLYETAFSIIAAQNNLVEDDIEDDLDDIDDIADEEIKATG